MRIHSQYISQMSKRSASDAMAARAEGGLLVWFQHPYQVWPSDDGAGYYHFVNVVTSVNPGLVHYLGGATRLVRLLADAYNGRWEFLDGILDLGEEPGSVLLDTPPLIVKADNHFDTTLDLSHVPHLLACKRLHWAYFLGYCKTMYQAAASFRSPPRIQRRHRNRSRKADEVGKVNLALLLDQVEVPVEDDDEVSFVSSSQGSSQVKEQDPEPAAVEESLLEPDAEPARKSQMPENGFQYSLWSF